MNKEISKEVSIPVMAKCRIGHFAEAQILEAIEIDYMAFSFHPELDDDYSIHKKFISMC